MSPRTIRRLVVVVFVSGITGMIIGSINDNNGVAITFGLITAAAALGLILVTAVAPPETFDRGRRAEAPPDEEAAARLEERIDALVRAGGDEAELRELVRQAVALGRRLP